MNEADQLIAYFSKFTSFTPEEKDALKESMVVKRFKKDSFLLKEGQRDADTFFVLDGLVRRYKLVDGNEISTNFFTAGQWIISLTGFEDNVMADDNLVCMEDTSVVVGNEEKAQELFKTFPRFETISRAVMENVFASHHKMMSAYLTDTPEQRYAKLLSSNPALLQRVPQYHIASYIGVKPESLSRIRKRMAQPDL